MCEARAKQPWTYLMFCGGIWEGIATAHKSKHRHSHVNMHIYTDSVKHPALLTPSKRRSLRVSFEVPVVDGFNQLLGHLDNLLLTSWGEIQTQSYRGRHSEKVTADRYSVTPQLAQQPSLFISTTKGHDVTLLLYTDLPPVHSCIHKEIKHMPRSIHFPITRLITFLSLKDLLFKKQNKQRPNSKLQTQGRWLLLYRQSGCSSSIVQETVVIPQHTPTHGLDH